MDKNNIYRKKECEICGKYTFEKFIETKGEFDGGFTQIEEWEESGFGSMVVCYHSLAGVRDSRLEYKLCPDCAKKIDLSIYRKIAELQKEIHGG